MAAAGFSGSGTMVIGIISDTHGELSDHAVDALRGCDAIIHAGDIGHVGILYELETIAPVTAVLGNCDFGDFGSAVTSVAAPKFGGVRFRVTHRPEPYATLEPDVKVAVNGHTHVPQLDFDGAVLHVNPGSASDPRHGLMPSIAKVTVGGGAVLHAEIYDLMSTCPEVEYSWEASKEDPKGGSKE